MPDEYTEEEKALIRSRLREGNQRALEVARKRGVKVHPRVAAIKVSRDAGQSLRK